MPIIRSISGLRATYPDGLNAELIVKYVSAYEIVLPDGGIVVGSDGRAGGEWIVEIVINTLISRGRDVEFLGVVPTPTVQLITEKNNFAGGIVITASHNPAPWNGLKFLNGNGVFISQEENEKIWEYVDTEIPYSSNIKAGEIIKNKKAIENHINAVLNLPFIDKKLVQSIKKRELKVVVDAINCSGSEIIPKLLKKLGFEVIKILCDGTGVFVHNPEPINENLSSLKTSVLHYNADLGVAVDPDADRLVFVNEKGKLIGEEKTIALAIKSYLKFKKKNKEVINSVTINLSSSKISEDIAESHKIPCFRSPVGEINVVNEMKKNNSDIGGEGSGGVILPILHYGRDSLAGIALITYLIGNSKKKFSNLSSELSKYEMIKTKQDFNGDFDTLSQKILKEFKNHKIDKRDGLRIDLEDCWVQIRKSNTEPIIRIISEAKETEIAQDLIDKIKLLIN